MHKPSTRLLTTCLTEIGSLTETWICSIKERDIAHIASIIHYGYSNWTYALVSPQLLCKVPVDRNEPRPCDLYAYKCSDVICLAKAYTCLCCRDNKQHMDQGKNQDEQQSG